MIPEIIIFSWKEAVSCKDPVFTSAGVDNFTEVCWERLSLHQPITESGNWCTPTAAPQELWELREMWDLSQVFLWCSAFRWIFFCVLLVLNELNLEQSYRGSSQGSCGKMDLLKGEGSMAG